MRIDEFRIFNYKSYRATDPIPLAPRFNVFIGKNNAGKTALLESLSLTTLANHPHRQSGILRGQPFEASSKVELRATLTVADLHDALFNAQNFWFPIPKDLNHPEEDRGESMLRDFLRRPPELEFVAEENQRFDYQHPSHKMFQGP